jgi:beta-galactosidase beta subunit
MKVLTRIEKKKMMHEADAILASIPGYELRLSSYDSPYDYIFITDKGYFSHIELDRGEHIEKFLGKTYREAVKGIAKSHIQSVSYEHISHPYSIFFDPDPYRPSFDNSQYEEMKQFEAYCNSFIDKA